VDLFTAFAAFSSPGQWRRCGLRCHPGTETQSWDDDQDLFSLDTSWYLARAFLMQIGLTALPPDFQNSGTESNQEVGGHFGCLSYIFNSFDD
jgi:hypothetical protein